MLCGKEPITATEIAEGQKETFTIDITPSWSSLVGVMLLVLETSGNEGAKQDMRDEFSRMAKIADLYVEEHKDDE